MLTVAIVGASGYTGAECARLLANHPGATLTVATSRQYAGKRLGEIFPNLEQFSTLVCEDHSVEEICARAEFIFCAVPHKTAMDIVPRFLSAGKKVVDLSADYRLRDQAVYEAWYQEHSSPELLGETVYGLPELYRDMIKGARLVANPGCYPTSVILALGPLLRAGAVELDSIVIDAKSGTSGAGRAASVPTLFCEVTDGFRPYKVGGVHRHIPEIEQELGILAQREVTVSFTPHLLPISRGILSTIYAQLIGSPDEEELRGLYRAAYGNEFFIRLLKNGRFPATQYVRGSNFCDIGLAIDRRTNRVIITSAIDNIVKGAAGQAVQNMNLMCGFPENSGLQHAPLFP